MTGISPRGNRGKTGKTVSDPDFRDFPWNSLDLERKVTAFKDYYDDAWVHASLDGNTPRHSAALSNKPHADRELRLQRKILAGEDQVRISPLGGKLGLGNKWVVM